MSMAFKVNNDQELPARFQISQIRIFDHLLQVTFNGPSHLNAEFLQSLWDTFEDKSASRGQETWSHFVFYLPVLAFVSSSPT